MDIDDQAKAPRVRPLLLVAAVSLGAAILITGAWEISHERILENERARLLANLSSVVDAPAGSTVAVREIVMPELEREEHIMQAFALFDGATQLGWVYSAEAPEGYNGPIEFLLGIAPDGHIIRARVMRHRETPGLGDAIETDKSDWIGQFEGRSITNPSQWALAVDGGAFDAITGATVTPRALVEAIAAVLTYHTAHGDRRMDEL